jgi:ATP-dependent exoDNAse (exonuclease V) beta subunit
MSLSQINKHYRDDFITFQEEGHIYTLQSLTIFYKIFLIKQFNHICDDNKTIIIKYLIKLTSKRPTSVTTLIHSLFPHFDADKIIKKMMSSANWINSQYFGMTADEIKDQWNDNGKKQSALGSQLHAQIEDTLNGKDMLDEPTPEYKMFQQFWYDFQEQYPQFKPYRLEHVIFDETFRKGQGLCGSVDCILSNADGHIIILDWKRSKEIKGTSYERGYYPFNNMPNCNLSHYQLQLNIYRHILETKYDKNVIFMMLCIFHPNQKTYKCIPVEHIELSHLWDSL